MLTRNLYLLYLIPVITAALIVVCFYVVIFGNLDGLFISLASPLILFSRFFDIFSILSPRFSFSLCIISLFLIIFSFFLYLMPSLSYFCPYSLLFSCSLLVSRLFNKFSSPRPPLSFLSPSSSLASTSSSHSSLHVCCPETDSFILVFFFSFWTF